MENKEAGSSFHFEPKSPGLVCTGDSRISDFDSTLPFKSPPFKSLTLGSDLELDDQLIDSHIASDQDQVIPSGLETLVNAREVHDVSWTSSMATPLSKNVTYSNLNTDERRVFLPSDDCATAVRRRALFTPDLFESSAVPSETSETPKVERTRKSNVGRLLTQQLDSSVRSHLGSFSFCTPSKKEQEEEQAVKRKSSEALSPAVSKKRLKMQRNRSRNKVVGSPDTKAEAADRTSCSVDLFDDSGEDIFSEFDNASSTPSRSTSEKSGSYAGSRAASMENSLSSRNATLVDDLDDSTDLNKCTELDKTVVEAPLKTGWSPDDSFSEAMLIAFPSETSPVSLMKSRVQSIKKASLNPSLLYTEEGTLPASSETAEDILKSMAPQYRDLQPSKASTLTSVKQELVPFSLLDFKKPCSVDNQVTPVGEQEVGVMSPTEETSMLTDQQLIQAGEEAEMLLLLEKEDDWLLSELDQCSNIGGKAVETADQGKPAEVCLVKTTDSKEEVLDDGFKTANGRDILVSPEALRKATALFAAIDKVEETNDSSEGFSLASGKKVTVSQEALRRAQKILADDGEPDISSDGFRTASGQNIVVSREALEKAKKLFDDDDETKEVLSQPKKRKFESLSEDAEKSVEAVETVGDEAASKKIKSSSDAVEDEVTLDDLCSEIENMENSGFSTASGNKVSISDESLKKVAGLFDDATSAEEELLEIASKRNRLKAKAENGFLTASGKAVTVSESSLAKAMEIMSDETDVASCLESASMEGSVGIPEDSGFVTASGKKVNVSESALEKARSFFEDCSSEDDLSELAAKTRNQRKNSPRKDTASVGFSTANGKKVTVSNDALLKARQLFADENSEGLAEVAAKTRNRRMKSPGEETAPLGFATANGRKVAVSEDALMKARRMFADENSEEDLSELTARTRNRRTAVSNSPGKDTGSVGFSTANGKEVTVSNEALMKARQLLTDENCEEDLFELAARIKSSQASLRKNSPGKGISLVGFATASGKKVPVSNEALKKAKQLFADENSKEDLSEMAAKTRNQGKNSPEEDVASVGFSTANGKKVTVSNEALIKAKQWFADENSEEDLSELAAKTRNRRKNSPGLDPAPVGFSTANGKKVTVSNDALLKAKQLFTHENSEVDLSELASKTRNRRTAVKNSPGEHTAPVGFATANGKKVTVSDGALMKARQLFADGNSEEDLFELAARIKSSQASLRNSQASPKKAQMSKLDINLRSGQEFSENGKKAEDTDIVGGIPASKKNLALEKGFEFESSPIGEQRVGFTTDSLKGARTLFKNVEDEDENSDKAELQNMSPTVGGSSERRQRKRKSRLCEKGFKVPFPVKQTANPAEDGLTPAKRHKPPAHSGRAPIDILREVPHSFTSADGQPTSVPQQEQTNENGMKRNLEEDNPVEYHALSKPHTKKSLSPSKPLSPEQVPENPSDKSLSQEILESTAAFLADESENSAAFPTPRLIEPVTSHPSAPEDRINAPEPVTTFPEDCSPIAAPSSPILGERASGSQRKSRRKSIRKATGRLSLSSSLAGKDLTPLAKTESVANVSLPVPLKVESPAPEEVWEDDEMLTKLEIDDVISEASRIKEEEEQLGCGRELRPEVSEARKRAAEEQEKVVKAGIAAKKGPKIAKGSLFAKKTASSKNQRSWKAFLGSEKPGTANRDELRRLGVGSWVCNVTGENAANFRFNAWDHYSADLCRENVFGLPVGDGARLILNDEGTAGVGEVERAFLASAAVDPKLVPAGWVRNHYRWIVWKLAAMERRFPKQFARVLTPHIVMQQLKYRYDREIDRCQRPALRKILEHDDTPARRMVTCVAAIRKVDGESGSQIELELTDGWYSVLAVVDNELQSRVAKGKVASGTKIMTHGAELVNCPQGCPPLEIGPDVRLKITSNSSRRARWDAKLGFQRDPRPFKIPLPSILANGGMVGCVSVFIARVYPMVYLEKKDKARTVVRCERAERREAALDETRRQKATEQIYVQAQAEVQLNESNPTKTKRHVTRQLLANATSPQELCALMESAVDPVAFENMLSEEQKRMVLDLQREKQETLCREVQSKVIKRLEEKSVPQRTVTPVMKIRLVDGKNPDSDCSAFLSIYHPSEETSSLFKESQLTTMYSLTVNGWRGGVLQLSATRSTHYQQERESALTAHLTRRITLFGDLYSRTVSPVFGEVDIVGAVVRVDSPPQQSSNNNVTPVRAGSQYQAVYLADEEKNIVAVSFWGGLREFGVDDIFNPGAVLSMANLQWRGGALKGPICLYAQEVSVFTANPRQQTLRDAIQALQKIIKPDVNSFVQSCEEKLEDLLNSATPYKNETSRLRNESPNAAGTPKAPGKIEMRTSTPVQHSPLASNLKEYSPGIQERLKKLEMYGDASPLPPLVMAQRRSSLRRGFRPPRRALDTSAAKPASSNADGGKE